MAAPMSEARSALTMVEKAEANEPSTAARRERHRELVLRVGDTLAVFCGFTLSQYGMVTAAAVETAGLFATIWRYRGVLLTDDDGDAAVSPHEDVEKEEVAALGKIREHAASNGVTDLMPLDRFPPAPGQGAICIESRIGDDFEHLGLTICPDIDSVLRLLAATLLAGAIGIGPELRDKPAGLRTHMLTGLAAALFTLITFAIREKALSGEPVFGADPIRIIEAVTAGVAPRLRPDHSAISPTSVRPSCSKYSGRNGITSVKPVKPMKLAAVTA